jgi:hypothetical protein
LGSVIRISSEEQPLTVPLDSLSLLESRVKQLAFLDVQGGDGTDEFSPEHE